LTSRGSDIEQNPRGEAGSVDLSLDIDHYRSVVPDIVGEEKTNTTIDHLIIQVNCFECGDHIPRVGALGKPDTGNNWTMEVRIEYLVITGEYTYVLDEDEKGPIPCSYPSL
jgi:hypothetical protein